MENYELTENEKNLRKEIESRRDWLLALAYAKEYGANERDGFRMLPKDLMQTLVQYLPLYYSAERENGNYPKDGDKATQEASFKEYSQLLKLRNFARLALFSKAYDLLDHLLFSDIHPEDGDSRYGINFQYSMLDFARKHSNYRERFLKKKYYDKGFLEGKEETQKELRLKGGELDDEE